MMEFTVISEFSNIEIIALGSKIKDVERLRKVYGKGRWRKIKGLAKVKFTDGTVNTAEIHWYEAHGIGKKEFKIKTILD